MSGQLATSPISRPRSRAYPPAELTGPRSAGSTVSGDVAPAKTGGTPRGRARDLVRLALIAVALSPTACSGSAPVLDAPAKVELARAYLAQLAPLLVSRTLTADEVFALQQSVTDTGDTQAGLEAVVAGWVEEPALAEAARELLQRRLGVSGNRDGVNYELPGNLAAATVIGHQPWSTILTADHCVGDDLQPIECDSGSPYSAGVLTTRGFLRRHGSRFNLKRASTTLRAFACASYPLDEALEPRIPRERLRTMFKAESPEDQEDPSVADQFGNGFACYTCHGQFSWHAQLYVQFDEQGMFRSDATGIQDPAGELGRSAGGLYASHFADPVESASPSSQMLGQPAATLVEAGAILAASESFARCTFRGVLEYGLGLGPADPIDEDLLAELAAGLGTPGEASFAGFVLAAFTHPRVFDAVAQDQLRGAQERQP